MTEYVLAKKDEDFKTAAALFTEYADWLGVNLCFQGFNEELQQLDKMYSAADGGIILCKKEDEFIGCVAIRRMDTHTAELKRMWVRLPYQGQGIGEQLLKESLALVAKLQYRCIRLDTLQRLAPAIKLYKKYGFVETAAYYDNPNKDVVYMEKRLKSIA